MNRNSCTFLLLFFIIFYNLVSCKQTNNNTTTVSKKEYKKPPASNSDTLLIDKVSAVFYQPDSLQLIKIKQANSTNVFNSMAHELFYQMRNARIVIKQYYTKVNIIETNSCRFLKFKTTLNKEYLIDLNNYNDMSGIFLFNKKDGPLQTDMMNIDTDLGLYFK